MTRLLKSIYLATFVLLFFSTFVLAEEITITTYYPSPYGSYNYLQTDKLGVGDNNGDAAFTSADVPTNAGEVWIKGNVGIGKTSPAGKLDVKTSTANDGLILGDGTRWIKMLGGTLGAGAYNNMVQANDNAIIYSAGSLGTGAFVIAPWASATSGIRMISSGNVGIGTTTPGYALDVTGQIRMSGVAGTKLVVADVAEVIPVADDVEEGDVVNIDNTVKTYQFAKSKTPDSLLVAGVISSTDKDGKSIPALFIGDAEQKAKANPNQKYKYLAIAGQIEVKVCLEGGTIKKGDLLTTSSLAGYAMKSQSKQSGTLIGKALEDFDGKDGVKGTIIALIGLM